MSFDAEKLVDAMSAALDLPVDPDHRPGVVAHLEAAFGATQKMREIEIGPHSEPAPVFHPKGPEA